MGIARRLAAAGLVVGPQGNVSARDPASGLVAITPSGMEYERMGAEDVPVLDLRGHPVEGRRRPSTELPTHLAIYRHRADVGAIVHTHSPYATTLAVLGWPLPPVLGEAAAVLGGEVAVAPYATTGTELLARHAVQALGDRQAVLLQSHGAVAVGRDLREALHAALVLESTARIYWMARLAGPVSALAPDEVARIRQGFLRHYGQPRPGRAAPLPAGGPRRPGAAGSAGAAGAAEEAAPAREGELP